MKTKSRSRKALVRDLDTVVSKYIRLRDKKCVVCGSTENLTNGHLFSRVTYSTRWDTGDDENCHCQCLSCNLSHEYNAGPFTSWYVHKFGVEKYDELHYRYSHSRPYKDWELAELLEEKKKQLKDLGE